MEPFAPEVRERAVRMGREHREAPGSQGAAIGSIAAGIGCSGETLRSRARQAERDDGAGPVLAKALGTTPRWKGASGSGPWSGRTAGCGGPTSRRPARGSESLRKASACFARAELGRPPKR